MAAVVSLRSATPGAPRVSTALPPLKADEAALGLVNELRLVGLRCRAARKAPPIEACQLISAPEAPHAATLDMLMRSLPQALGRAPVLFAPGTAELSFDEAWLLQLVAAVRAGDADSAGFLLRSRVPAYARRALVFLLKTALAPQ